MLARLSRKAILIGSALTLSISAPPAVAAIKCTFIQRERCQPGQPCSTVKPVTWAHVDSIKQTYARCDAKGCDTYPAPARKSGYWTLFDIGRGMIAKLGAGGELVEIVTLNDVALVSYGRCAPI